jgi:hypothetical protein
MFLILKCILILIFFFNWASNAEVLDLKCRFLDHTSWKNLGYACDMEGDRGAISYLNENDTFVFTDVTEEQKSLVKTVLFRTPNVNFVPKEAFTTFPYLNRISIHGVQLDSLEVDFFRFFPENHNITMYDFASCSISKIDPEVWKYFQKANYFLFEGNECLNEEIREASVLSRKIQKCFNNYINSNLYLKKVIKEISESLSDRLSLVEKSVDERLKNIESSLGKILEGSGSA